MHKNILIFLLMLLVGCGQKKEQLNLFFWPDYIDPQIVVDFEKQFNCRVVIDRYDNPDSMLAKMSEGGASIYDVVIPSNSTLPLMIQRGLVAPLRLERIPNLKNIDPQFTNTYFDPGNHYSAPFGWGTTGIFMRKPKDKPIQETWGLIFDPQKQLGPFTLLNDARACIGAALRYKGHSSNTTNLEELQEALTLLVETKKRSLGFESGAGAVNRVLSHGATLAMGYTETKAIVEDPETLYLIPREGTELWLDLLAIPAHAPHRDLAESFINYFLQGKVAAQNAIYLRSATPNKAAFDLLDVKTRTNPVFYPPPEIKQMLEYNRDLGDRNRLYDELWTQIKSK